jgi:hypothetical protein
MANTPKAAHPVTGDEVQILLADLTQRQQEIIDRGRSENYLYVVFFTAVGAIVAAVVVFLSHGKASFPDFLPTLVCLGALVLLCLPVNLVHLGSVTELRRMYVQENLEPRLRELGGNLAGSRPLTSRGVFSFESYDRAMHHGAFNFVIAVRSAFMSLPAFAMLCFYVYLRVEFWNRFDWPLWIVEGVLILAIAFVSWVIIRSFAHLWKLLRDVQDRSTTPAVPNLPPTS